LSVCGSITGDPVFSGSVYSTPVMTAIYMGGVTHDDLVSAKGKSFDPRRKFRR
jgi:hypothetical protein